ncbi:hypothetical protein HPB47_015493 [Ixodes persulcatus]|uniref:Uncharacterized protein n=1 Tax=Ixodes persulcatus TaxID=34615 RepID=A0AC60QTC7_IXOPE|nr:hypothetical protein HPB47_015493 [Ixodes persulcatus]
MAASGACGSTPGTFDYGPQGRVILPSPWSTDLTAVPRRFDDCKIEAYRASTLASSRQVARSNKFVTEAYVDPASLQVLRSTTGVLIKARCFRSQKKTATPYQVVCDIQQSGDSLLVTPTEAAVLERNTRQQAKSPLWKAARRTRLTASCFGEAAERESWTLKGLANLTSSKDLSRVRAVRHGIKYEPVAVQRYESCLRALGHDVQTFPCGILVHPECPWLGASPDRVVWDPSEATPHGVVEAETKGRRRRGPVSASTIVAISAAVVTIFKLNWCLADTGAYSFISELDVLTTFERKLSMLDFDAGTTDDPDDPSAGRSATENY